MKPGIELTLQQQRHMVVALQAVLTGIYAKPVRLIETHISYVLIGSVHAYKFKKVMRTAFLDQSSLTARLQACREELRLNRRMAPTLYLEVVPVTRSWQSPELGGEGFIIDFAVKMRAFSQDQLWDKLAHDSALRPAFVDDLLAQLLPFHAGAARAEARGRVGSPDQIHALVLANIDELEQLAIDEVEHATLQHLRAWEADHFAQIESVLTRRLEQGRVRECHGDLHLGNIAQVDGRATVFDAIDFSAEYRTIDVMSDVAFLAMDLQAHGLPGLARRFVNGYLEATGDYEGVQVLDYYLVHRALVRAKIALLRAAQQPVRTGRQASGKQPVARRATDLAEHYLALARRFSLSSRPVLLVTHGYSGSGKSTLTQVLVESSDAIRIRSDVERKRLASGASLSTSLSTPASTSLPGQGTAELYGSDMTAATYERLFELARLLLQAGRSVILDATFLRQADRAAARHLAVDLGLPCVLLDFDLPAASLRDRLRLRALQGTDVSDADVAVLERQLATAEPLTPAERESAYTVPQGGGQASTTRGVDWAPLLRRYPQMA
ncbi:MAG: AAA family ATPase [Burkholderiales bacterium]|nr:AAA family ATPase [Burkholderiales bacterium]